MYSLLTEFRDGDNVVTTHAWSTTPTSCPGTRCAGEILPRFGRTVECRIARFDPETGELDLDHLASLVDSRTKLVCCTGASNFLGTKPPLAAVRAIADGERLRAARTASAARCCWSTRRSWCRRTLVDVRALDVDYLAFSFHKLLAPFGVGVLYAREHLLERSLPFLYGGDMVAEGRVSPERVEYGELPWKFAAGTPNILGVIVSAQALRLLADLALDDGSRRFESRAGRSLARTW